MKVYEGKHCRVYGNDWTKLTLSPYAQMFYAGCDPMTILEHETDDGTCEYAIIGLCATTGWLLGEDAIIRHIEECAMESYLELAKDYHWTEEILRFACKFYGCPVPENAAEIVANANKEIDEFARCGGWYETVEIEDLSEILLEIYCKTGDLTASYEDIAD